MGWPETDYLFPCLEAGNDRHGPIINKDLTHAVTVDGHFAMFPRQILLCWVQFTFVFKSAVTTMCELITFGRQWIRINISLLRICASVWKCVELIYWYGKWLLNANCCSCLYTCHHLRVMIYRAEASFLNDSNFLSGGWANGLEGIDPWSKW